MQTICFIGGGNMATALIGGILASGYQAEKITVVEPDTTKHAALKSLGKLNTAVDANDVVGSADVVVLAVKPQILKPVCQGLASDIGSPLVISIAAGIQASAIDSWLGGGRAIVRCMPNTPSLVQAGATGLYANDAVNDANKAFAAELLSAVGISVWVEDEAGIDAVTAISGSGPAYLFLFIEALQTAGEKLGLTAETAKQLALQTAYGASKMALNSDDQPGELRRKVTSPGGTTEQAILSFQREGLESLVANATAAAARRSAELADELGK